MIIIKAKIRCEAWLALWLPVCVRISGGKASQHSGYSEAMLVSKLRKKG